mgnify:CR=1 FL=1
MVTWIQRLKNLLLGTRGLCPALRCIAYDSTITRYLRLNCKGLKVQQCLCMDRFILPLFSWYLVLNDLRRHDSEGRPVCSQFVTGMIHRIFTSKLADYRRRLNVHSGGDANYCIFGSK